MSHNEEGSLISFPPYLLTAFGRMRVAQLSTQLDIKHTQDDNPLFIDQVTNGAATISRNVSESSMIMTTTNSGDYAIAKSFQSFAYLSGKTLIVKTTGSRLEAQTGITKRTGYFSTSIVAPYTADRDGLYIDSNGTDVGVNVSNFGTNTRVEQSNWNVDTCDGTGSSGFNADWTKRQIFFIDLQYLGVGAVRWFIADSTGEPILFHISMHANLLGEGTYMRFSNHPLRYEIRQSGATAGTLKYICASVSTEGESGDVGKVLAHDNGSSHIDANSSGTKYALLGLRLKSTHLNTLVKILSTSILAETQDNFKWDVLVNPNVNGTITWNNVSNSALQLHTGINSNTVTGGTKIASGYVAVSRQAGGSGNAVIKSSLRLGSAIDGTRDTIFLCATPLSSNLDILGALTTQEFD